jgi:hypothetical protein
MNYHNLLVEMTDENSEYIKQFENEKNYQQMINKEPETTNKDDATNKSDNIYSTNTPRSGAYSSNNVNEKNMNHPKKPSFGNLKNYMTSNLEPEDEKNFRSVSQIEREKEYDLLFSHLEINGEQGGLNDSEEGPNKVNQFL